MTTPLHGGSLCGAIRYTVSRPWNPIDAAHEQHPEGAPPMPPAR